MKKLKIRELCRDFIEKEYQLEISSLTDKQRSLGLLKYYISEIHNKLRNEISDEEFDDAVVDNSKDLGIDLIHKDDKNVLIIQSKFRAAGKSESPEDISYFQKVISRLVSDDFTPNEKLKDIVSSIDFESDTFRLVYLALSGIQNQAKTQSEQPVDFPSKYPKLSERCTWEFLSEADLDQELRNANSIGASIPDEKCVLHSQGKAGKRAPIIEVQSGGYKSIVLAIEAPQIINIYQHIKDGLFNLNIRNYIGNTKTNSSIRETAELSPEKFLYFNNGISCLAKKIDVDHDSSKVTATGLQVINGAQTVRALSKASRKEKWSDHPPLLIVRITELGTGYGADGRLTEEITRYNNTQNVIKDSDFRSNDSVQRDLADKFSQYRRHGRQVTYIAKRTDRRPPNSEIIRLEEFAKTIFAFLKDPIAFSGSTSFLFNDDPDSGGYAVVFGDGKQVWDVFPIKDFRLRSAIWWMALEFSERIAADRKAAIDPLDRQALERKWMILYMAKLILRRSMGENFSQVLEPHYKGDWRLGNGSVGGWFERLYLTSKQSILYLYKGAAKRPGFVHRNWMRSRQTIQEIEAYASDAPGLDLPKPGKPE